jgi:hypothetical protein
MSRWDNLVQAHHESIAELESFRGQSPVVNQMLAASKDALSGFGGGGHARPEHLIHLG